MLTRAKLPIRLRMFVRLQGAVRLSRRGNDVARPELIGRPLAATGQIVGVVGDAAVQALERVGHSGPGQNAHISRLGLIEKFRNIARGKSVVLQA